MLHTTAFQLVFGMALLGARQLDAQTQQETVVWPASGIRFDDNVSERLVVRQIAPDSRAALAGVQPGDTVLTMDQHSFTTPAEVEAYLAGRGSQPVHLIVLREGEQLPVVYAGDPVDWNDRRIPQPGYGQPAGIGIRVAGSRPIVIVAVYNDSPADRAGVLPGDRLLAVNDVTYPQVHGVSAAIAQHPAGEEIRLTIQRDGADQVVTVTPEEWALVFDEPPHVLPGWESRYRRSGCYVGTDDFAIYDAACRGCDRCAGRDTFAEELTGLRDEIRKLRQELTEAKSRLDALQAKLAEE